MCSGLASPPGKTVIPATSTVSMPGSWSLGYGCHFTPSATRSATPPLPSPFCRGLPSLRCTVYPGKFGVASPSFQWVSWSGTTCGLCTFRCWVSSARVTAARPWALNCSTWSVQALPFAAPLGAALRCSFRCRCARRPLTTFLACFLFSSVVLPGMLCTKRSCSLLCFSFSCFTDSAARLPLARSRTPLSIVRTDLSSDSFAATAVTGPSANSLMFPLPVVFALAHQYTATLPRSPRARTLALPQTWAGAMPLTTHDTFRAFALHPGIFGGPYATPYWDCTCARTTCMPGSSCLTRLLVTSSSIWA